ncbi:hypothetical protein J6590_061620, partial [Homalodisca vitripennis]
MTVTTADSKPTNTLQRNNHTSTWLLYIFTFKLTTRHRLISNLNLLNLTVAAGARAVQPRRRKAATFRTADWSLHSPVVASRRTKRMSEL